MAYRKASCTFASPPPRSYGLTPKHAPAFTGEQETLQRRSWQVSKVNWLRLIIGGLVASVVCFLTDGFFHERVVAADWAAVYASLSAAESQHNVVALVYFAIFELGRGLVGVFLYVMMRQRFGPGPKTAVLAAIVTGWPSQSRARRNSFRSVSTQMSCG
jgi:hypothetical protein